MEFKLGQKYRIVDIDAWWSRSQFDKVGHITEYKFRNGDIVVVNYDHSDKLSFFLVNSSLNSHVIKELKKYDEWHDSCIELITDDIPESDDTISLYHVADVLEDLIVDEGYAYKSYVSKQLRDKINLCINSLRKAGY